LYPEEEAIRFKAMLVEVTMVVW